MENKMNYTNGMGNMPEQANQVQRISVMTGSSRNFRGIPEPCDFNPTRPLTVSAWTQTINEDFSVLNAIEVGDQRSQREKELEAQIKLLEENLRAHSNLLSQIHETSARTSALLGQQQLNIQDTDNIPSTSANARMAAYCPKIVNAINSGQQVSCYPNESYKYRIIADGTGIHSDEPIEIQLAEDDGALNLNSSADSGRLEICLSAEENIEIKSECPTSSNRQHQAAAPATNHVTPNDVNFITKRKMGAEQQQTPKIKIKRENKQKPRKNSTPRTPRTENNNINGGMRTPTTSSRNMLPSDENRSYLTPQNSSYNNCDVSLDNVFVSLGPNNTRVPAKLYNSINWSSSSIATRRLLMATFGRHTLATHSMTGKPSPAFKDHNKPVKEMLNPLVVADIIYTVTRKCKVSDKEVRNSITTKCADENKMMKLQVDKQIPPEEESNKENME